MDSNAKRYCEIDLYRGLGIICTVTAASGMLSAQLQYRFDALCFPLFMMAAGAVWHKKGFKTDEKTVIKQEAYRSLKPYLWFSLIYLVIDALAMFISPEIFGLRRLYNHIWDSVSFMGISVLSFLPAYFVAVTAYRMFRYNFKLPTMCIILSIVAFTLTGILYFRGFPGLYDADNMDLGIDSYGLRLAMLFWRGSVGMFFCAWGEVIGLIAEKLKEKKLITVILFLLLTGGGIGLSFLTDSCNYRTMVTGNPLVVLPMSLGLAGGLLFLCIWIGTIRPIDFLGRHAIIIYLSFWGFGILRFALMVGDIVFAKTINNFAYRATVAIVILLFELIVIALFRLKCFSFLLGGREFKEPEIEEDVL